MRAVEVVLAHLDLDTLMLYPEGIQEDSRVFTYRSACHHWLL